VLALAGIPPLSGFLGKVLISQGAITSQSFVLLALGLLSSFVVLYSLIRIFMNVFWGETIMDIDEIRPLHPMMLIPIVMLVGISFVLGLGSELIAPYVTDAAETLMNPQIYIEAILDK